MGKNKSAIQMLVLRKPKENSNLKEVGIDGITILEIPLNKLFGMCRLGLTALGQENVMVSFQHTTDLAIFYKEWGIPWPAEQLSSSEEGLLLHQSFLGNTAFMWCEVVSLCPPLSTGVQVTMNLLSDQVFTG